MVDNSLCERKLWLGEFWLSILASPAFSTPVFWCHDFHSRVFQPCCLVLRIPLPRFQSPPTRYSNRKYPCPIIWSFIFRSCILMWWHLILHFQVLHFLVLHFQRPPFNAAVRSISLACPADYCFIVTHWHNIWSFLANKRERERGGEIAHTTQ